MIKSSYNLSKFTKRLSKWLPVGSLTDMVRTLRDGGAKKEVDFIIKKKMMRIEVEAVFIKEKP